MFALKFIKGGTVGFCIGTAATYYWMNSSPIAFITCVVAGLLFLIPDGFLD